MTSDQRIFTQLGTDCSVVLLLTLNSAGEPASTEQNIPQFSIEGMVGTVVSELTMSLIPFQTLEQASKLFTAATRHIHALSTCSVA